MYKLPGYYDAFTCKKDDKGSLFDMTRLVKDPETVQRYWEHEEDAEESDDDRTRGKLDQRLRRLVDIDTGTVFYPNPFWMDDFDKENYRLRRSRSERSFLQSSNKRVLVHANLLVEFVREFGESRLVDEVKNWLVLKNKDGNTCLFNAHAQ